MKGVEKSLGKYTQSQNDEKRYFIYEILTDNWVRGNKAKHKTRQLWNQNLRISSEYIQLALPLGYQNHC